MGKTGSMDETVIVTYSPKYKVYQQKIRNCQIEHAQQMISSQEKKEKVKTRMILQGDINEILKINCQRWKIEENLRIMKSEFGARPVYARREDRSRAHFLTCYINLLVYRLLEKKLQGNYTCEQILRTLQGIIKEPKTDKTPKVEI